ncbi:hypothetical protein GCM10023200_01470 [Actinomycetospora chlora]|uniref:O-antigen ligase n=2 Tax=Actinomycetospora chlora TaxID=663608 RepID=A0ABP9A2N4_9PSEU
MISVPEPPTRDGMTSRTGPRVPAGLPAGIVLLAVPFLRPNLLGEQLAVVGAGLVGVAALLALVRRGDPAVQADLVPTRRAWTLVTFLGLAYVWLLLRAAGEGSGPNLQSVLQDVVLTVGSVAGVATVCRERRSARWVATGFVVIIGVMCASWIVTALLWGVLGVGGGQIGQVPVGGSAQPLYLPFTVTYSEQTVFGVAFPRFTGLGRESGWMAMYCAVAYFVARQVGLRRAGFGLVLLLGLIGCISTSGFGVFVVVWAYDQFIRPRAAGIGLKGYLRQLFGVVALGLAAWVAVTAPVLGLAAKRTQNVMSLDERNRATEAGWNALFTDPWGGATSVSQGGVNLISDIGVNGLPFVVLVLAALLVPVALGGGRGRSTAVTLVVLLTLLLAQPAGASAWAFAVCVVAFTLDDAAPDDESPAPEPTARVVTA